MTTNTVSIRRARSADAAGLSAVFDAAWREAYQGVIPGGALERFLARRGPETWRGMIEGGRGLAVVAFDAAQLRLVREVHPEADDEDHHDGDPAEQHWAHVVRMPERVRSESRPRRGRGEQLPRRPPRRILSPCQPRANTSANGAWLSGP